MFTFFSPLFGKEKTCEFPIDKIRHYSYLMHTYIQPVFSSIGMSNNCYHCYFVDIFFFHNLARK